MAVEDFEQAVVADLGELLGGDGPSETRMIDMWNAAFRADRVNVALENVDDRRTAVGRHGAVQIEPVDVQWLVTEAIDDLFAFDDPEPLVGAVQRVQSID